MPVIPTASASRTQAFYPQAGQGTYIGKVPGSSNYFPYAGKGYSAATAQVSDAGLTIQTDGNVAGSYISTLGAAPQNVMRLTGAFGTGFIQGSNIAFAMPYSGNASVRILPSTNQINVNNIQYVSTIAPIGTGGVGLAGQINMTQLASTIKGNGWAQVL